MLLKKFKPYSNSSRHKIRICKGLLLKKNRLIKNLVSFNKKSKGRCKIYGNITVRHKGSGVKTLSNKITHMNSVAKTMTLAILYDSSRSAFISVRYNFLDKRFEHSIATDNEYPGTLIESNVVNSDMKLGYRTSLSNIPTGSIVSQISDRFEQSSKYIKSAGAFGQVVHKTVDFVSIKLPSGTVRKFKSSDLATIGSLSNSQHFLQVLGTAGVNRRKGIRPSVRGIAMNPVDHPHGGRTNGGRPSVTPWGLPTKGKFKLKKRKNV
jgi:large subunit ribosomal protein L2